MTDTTKPRELTVAEVDAIAAKMAAACDMEGGYVLDGCMPPVSPDDALSLLRMARAMAWAQENAGEMGPDEDGAWSVKWGEWDRWVRWSYGASFVEAIEAAAADAARMTK